MKYCILCRQAFLEPDFFCPTHGLRLRIAEADQVKQCFGCGSVIERGEKFCRRCGFDVTDSDWPTSSGDLGPGDAPELDERDRAREASATAADEDLRLRPFRQTRARSQRGTRVRRHSRIGILLAAIIISVSIVAWHAVDLQRWSLVEHVFPFRTTSPVNLETNERAAPHDERSVTDNPQSGSADAEKPMEFAEALKFHGSALERDLSPWETTRALPPVELMEPPSEPAQLSERPEPSGLQGPSNNQNRSAEKSSEVEASKRSVPGVTQSAPARAPSPEEIQRQREAERRRVQKEVEEAIAIRGVSGVAVSFINGTVFLAGEVQTVSQREAAVRAARRIPDVKDVRSRILVKWDGYREP